MSNDVSVLSRRPKYPPIKDGNRVCYLLLHVCVPSDISPAPSVQHLDGIKSAQKAGKLLGIKIWPLRIRWKDKTGDFRYFFRFPRYRRDDKEAQRIGECFLYALALAFGPFIPSNETVAVFRVPEEVVRNTDVVPGGKLIQIEEARSYHDRTIDFPYRVLGITSCTTGDRFDSAWKITPVLLKNEELYRAVRFVVASQDDFFVSPGEIREVIGNPELTPLASAVQTKYENALHNAFKAIEAVLGDPPKDDAKFFNKIKSIGLDPDEEVGYIKKDPIHNVIRKMNKARDKKTAHGSTSPRNITNGELLEYQACAHLIVWFAIEKKLGERISDY